MPKGLVRIKLKSYDHRLIDDTCSRLVDVATKTGASFKGPIPLPTKHEKFVVQKATFIDKNSREHYELCTHKRLIDIVNPTNQTIDSLMHLDLPAGVSIEVKMG